MDLTNKWRLTYSSVCLIRHLNNDGKCIASGTGFKVIGNKIITNNHVFVCLDAIRTEISFFNMDGITINQMVTYDSEDLKKLLLAGDPENGWDFAILQGEDFNTIPGLVLAQPDYQIAIGSESYFLGFPLLSDSLTIHGGNISAKYSHASKIKYIQIDGSINAGNSGGPLIDFNTDCVIGLITRRQTGLTEKFSKLKESFRDNIKKMKAPAAKMVISGIDPIEVLKITQAQLNLLSDEISRSSNVGIGYAFELDLLRDYI